MLSTLCCEILPFEFPKPRPPQATTRIYGLRFPGMSKDYNIIEPQEQEEQEEQDEEEVLSVLSTQYTMHISRL